MRVFWASTVGFCTSFFSVFAPAALGPYIKMKKEEGGLGLSKDSASLAGNLAVTGTILMRVGAGPMCDKFGARKTFMILLSIAVPGCVMLMCAQGPALFVLGRVVVGLSLATFVTCQVWCSQFFASDIVGTVNATAGGWGNLGGGITLLVMPQIMELFLSFTETSMSPAKSVETSWRLCFLIPILLHILATLLVSTGKDLPDGSYTQLENMGIKQKSSAQGGGLGLVKVGFSNTNALILLITYGYCFGVELTMNNKLVAYFNQYYALPPRTASTLGATFSLMNLFARSWGGALSDWSAKRYGMRGRITSMWVCQTLCGVFCLLLGLVTIGKLNPDEPQFKGMAKVPGIWTDTSGLDDVIFRFNNSAGEGLVEVCGSKYALVPKFGFVDGVETRFPKKEDSRVMLKDPNPDCIHNGSTLGITMILIVFFSIFVQMAEGLTFGIVPKVSRPALGVVSGMVGAGGNFGALISGQFIIGSGTKAPFDEGFIYLGIVIICLTLLHFLIFFPGEGGILLPKDFPYDPQWIKPLANAKGADEIDFSEHGGSAYGKPASRNNSAHAGGNYPAKPVVLGSVPTVAGAEESSSM
jgi:nitrate/nitrite transporter NarK